MQRNYPEHIYEPIRVEVAKSYIRHELQKYLPSATGEWKRDIDKWFEGSEIGLFPARDFWNGFYGIVMGFKLLIGLTDFVTAENVSWTKEEIKIDDLKFTDFGEYTPRPVSDEPVIVTQKLVDGQDSFVVYDGNNRVNQAKKNGETKIEAYVSRFKGERRIPTNYWIPIGMIYELVNLARKAKLVEDNGLYQSYVLILKDLLSRSESGRYELIDRCLVKKDDFEESLKKDVGL
jgi:hypothetical protein